MNFEILGEITNIETIAIGNSIRDIARLRKKYGGGRIRQAEIHWYEAHGIGRKEIKRKRYLD